MRRVITLGSLLVVGLALVAAALALDARRRRLSAELVAVGHAAAPTSETRTTGTVTGASPATKTDASADDLAVLAARRDVADLEQKAEQRHAEIAAQSKKRMATAFIVDPNNHDPAQGMVMLDTFQNVGRATPAAAFQTVVWAALKGEDATLAEGLTLDDRARARAEVLIARQPESARSQLTPEKLAALWLEDAVVDAAAANIVSQTRLDDTHVNLIVRGGIAPGHTLTFWQTDSGWRLVVPEAGLEAVQKKVIGSSPPLK